MNMEMTNDTQETEQVEGSASQESTEGKTAQEILDLEKVEKFKFAGQEWTPKDMQNAYLRQADYTRKTQALAEEKKFMDNLSADLEAVKRDPSVAEAFKKVYPEKYHAYLGYVLPKETKADSREVKPDMSNLDNATLEDIRFIKAQFQQQQEKAAQAEIDSVFDKYSKKYPNADEEVVAARAHALAVQKGGRLQDADWDKLFKETQDKWQSKADKYWAEKSKNQTTVNQKNGDVGAGGGLPGAAPKVGRSIREASRLAMESGAFDNI